MIEVNNISFKYAGGHSLVFDDFSLTLKANNIYGLLGKNGTGKSTLLYLIAGLLRPKKGTVCFDSVETKKRRPETLQEIFIVPEEFDLPSMSLRQYVKINASFYPRFSHDVLQACLNDFALSMDVKLNALSMGQKKKVFMAFALATNTKVLLMDEPTNGLDIPSKTLFRQVITKHATENRTIIISTHQVKDVENLIDPIIILDHDEVLLKASFREITDKLYFDYGMDEAPEALYSEMIPGGYVSVTRNSNHYDSKISIEVLFNTVMKNKETIKQIFG